MFYGCDGATQQKFPVPLLAVILTAMKKCRSKVCLELEYELQRKTEAPRFDSKRWMLAARLRAEAEKSLEKHIKEMIAPFIMRTLKADL